MSAMAAVMVAKRVRSRRRWRRVVRVVYVGGEVEASGYTEMVMG